jgi:hypothetical protein
MTPPQPRAPRSPGRLKIERHAVHVGLVTRDPAETSTGRWEAEWWNGPSRKTIDHRTEEELITELHRVFGHPEGDPGHQETARTGRHAGATPRPGRDHGHGDPA